MITATPAAWAPPPSPARPATPAVPVTSASPHFCPQKDFPEVSEAMLGGGRNVPGFPGRGWGWGSAGRLLLLTRVAGLLGRHDYRGYGASVSLTGATVATHPTYVTDQGGARVIGDARRSNWTALGRAAMLLVLRHAFQHPLDFSAL
uniref:Uncharacterized protein n=1 Tax=Molossus molossus TaxID=27622 RepID=A0A7J8IA07_MOLMO|nr:hypothetical protein HJG59_010622 [Molossus molossus]